MELPSIDAEIREIVQNGSSTNRKTGFFIGTTRKADRNNFFLTPKRESRDLIAGSVVVLTVREAIQIASLLDGEVEYIFVDSEKKIGRSLWEIDDAGNIESAVRSTVKRSRVLTYKANDLTVQAIDGMVSVLASRFPKGIGGTSVCILGMGNVGSKVALSLVERGARIACFRRDQEALNLIVRALNSIKPPETLSEIVAHQSIEDAARGADIMIGLTPGIPIITPEVVEKINNAGFIIDGGKGNVSPEALSLAQFLGIEVYRTDIQPIVDGMISATLKMDTLLGNGLNRRKVGNLTFVDAGLLAAPGEIVVDRTPNPTRIFGVSNGRGELVPLEKVEAQGLLDTFVAATREGDG
jgi:hypothetical protein